MFKTIIAGSRGFDDYNKLCKVCDFMLSQKSNIEIVSGGARGADKLGERYAQERGHGLSIFLAEWDKHGKSAGFLRNREMAQYADALIAFWDGKSKGTEHMINLAKQAHLQVKIYYF